MIDRLLPGELREAPDGRRSARDWVVDVALFAVAVGLGVALLADGWSEHSELGAVLDIVAGIVSLLALWVRRTRPVAVAVIGLVAAIFSGLAAGASLVALFNAALRASRRALAAIVLLSIPPAVVYPLLYPGGDPYTTQLIVGALLTGVVIGWGLFARARRELVRSLQDRAVRLEAEQRLHVEQAREAERRRIAGEMHDVLAHRVSLLSLHAGALEFRPDAPPEEIAEAAGVIRATATDALRDLRHVIGVLRTGDDSTAPPQPTLDAIPALVEESRAAGMHVRSRIDASGGEVIVGRTAYRVVQEGLTNARKHAPAAAVEVTVGPAEERLVVEVVSRKSALAPPTQPGGSGLIGLTERVELAGGQLECGPNRRGDFVLRAVLPWT